jgi:Peptidase_C39 like family
MLRNARRSVVVTILLALALVGGVHAQVSYTGIPRHLFEYSASQQRSSQWCWAASIQMILNYHGVAISQEEIVHRTFGADIYGNLPDMPGTFQVITANLNNWGFDRNGRRYLVQASFGGGPPPPDMLLNEVSQGYPVLLAYQNGPNTGHAVVATAASYQPHGYSRIVTSIVVRDPWPNPENIRNNGRVEYQAASLAAVMTNYWIIRVIRQ